MKKGKLHNIHLTREFLHREYAGEIRLSDFNTTYPNSHRRQAYTRLEREARKNIETEEN